MMVFISLFFLKVVSRASPYSLLPANDHGAQLDSNILQRTKSLEGQSRGAESQERCATTGPELEDHPYAQTTDLEGCPGHRTSVDPSKRGVEEARSLMSRSSISHNREEATQACERFGSNECNSHNVDIRGFALIPKLEFWQLFSLLGILTGIGLMTIK